MIGAPQSHRLRICAFQPDFPHNLGGLFRLGACFGAGIDVVEPCGFPFSEKRVRQAGLDYIERADVRRFATWRSYLQERTPGRLVLLSTHARDLVWDVAFQAGDVLVMGRESAGVPDAVRADVDIAVRAPMAEGARSLNVVTAAAIGVAEAARQLGWRGG